MEQQIKTVNDIRLEVTDPGVQIEVQERTAGVYDKTYVLYIHVNGLTVLRISNIEKEQLTMLVADAIANG